MTHSQYVSTNDVAKILGISRIAVFKKIKNGQIHATKVGRTYVIDLGDIGDILDSSLSSEGKRTVERAVNKTVQEYGEALRLLGKD